MDRRLPAVPNLAPLARRPLRVAALTALGATHVGPAAGGLQGLAAF